MPPLLPEQPAIGELRTILQPVTDNGRLIKRLEASRKRLTFNQFINQDFKPLPEASQDNPDLSWKGRPYRINPQYGNDQGVLYREMTAEMAQMTHQGRVGQAEFEALADVWGSIVTKGKPPNAGSLNDFLQHLGIYSDNLLMMAEAGKITQAGIEAIFPKLKATLNLLGERYLKYEGRDLWKEAQNNDSQTFRFKLNQAKAGIARGDFQTALTHFVSMHQFLESAEGIRIAEQKPAARKAELNRPAADRSAMRNLLGEFKAEGMDLDSFGRNSGLTFDFLADDYLREIQDPTGVDPNHLLVRELKREKKYYILRENVGGLSEINMRGVPLKLAQLATNAYLKKNLRLASDAISLVPLFSIMAEKIRPGNASGHDLRSFADNLGTYLYMLHQTDPKLIPDDKLVGLGVPVDRAIKILERHLCAYYKIPESSGENVRTELAKKLGMEQGDADSAIRKYLALSEWQDYTKGFAAEAKQVGLERILVVEKPKVVETDPFSKLRMEIRGRMEKIQNENAAALRGKVEIDQKLIKLSEEFERLMQRARQVEAQIADGRRSSATYEDQVKQTSGEMARFQDLQSRLTEAEGLYSIQQSAVKERQEGRIREYGAGGLELVRGKGGLLDVLFDPNTDAFAGWERGVRAEVLDGFLAGIAKPETIIHVLRRIYGESSVKPLEVMLRANFAVVAGVLKDKELWGNPATAKYQLESLRDVLGKLQARVKDTVRWDLISQMRSEIEKDFTEPELPTALEEIAQALR